MVTAEVDLREMAKVIEDIRAKSGTPYGNIGRYAMCG